MPEQQPAQVATRKNGNWEGFTPLWDAGARINRLAGIVGAVHYLLRQECDELSDVKDAIGHLSVELAEIHEIIQTIAVNGVCGNEQQAG